MDAVTATTALAEAATQVLGAINEVDSSRIPMRYRRSLTNVEAKCQIAIAAIQATSAEVACTNKIINEAITRNTQIATQNALTLSLAINSALANYNTITDEKARDMVLDNFYTNQLPTLLEQCNSSIIDINDLRDRIYKHIR
jgi:hypothetical protein